MNEFKSLIPIFDWLPNYNKEWLKGDIGAGLTVGVMLIPQGMAYASIAGLPAVYGLYASIVPYNICHFWYFKTIGSWASGNGFVTYGNGNWFFSGIINYYISYAILLAFLVGVFNFY